MMASRFNPGNKNGDDDDDDEDVGESAMPGDYEPWPRVAPRITPSTTVRPPRPSVPPRSRSRRRPPPAVPSAASPRRRPPVSPTIPPIRLRRPRQRPLTPKIIIERQSHHHRSSGRERVMRVPLDNRPTLGLRGPPKRVLEIERVRCRRRRRSKSTFYEDDYDIPLSQPQSNAVVANPIANPCLPPVQSSLITSNSSTLFSNLTAEMIQNLPRHTVHLPPIHLPGSQADANTKLHTVIFPTEIINPIDGTLSIIQTNQLTNATGATNMYPSVTAPTQPQLINMSTNIGASMAMPAKPSGSLMQQFRNLIQQSSIPQTQASSSPPLIQPSLPVMTPYNSANNGPYNLQTVLRMNMTNTGPYPSANIQPTSTPHLGSYRSTIFPPANLTNTAPYHPANITTYRPPNFTSPSPASIQPYHPVGIAPSNISNTGPYHAANITPYSAVPNRPGGNSRLPYSFPSETTPYISSAGSINSNPIAYSSPSNIGISSLHASNPSQSFYQSGNTTPKSILRNAPLNNLSNTTYSRSNQPIVSSSNNTVRKKTTFT